MDTREEDLATIKKHLPRGYAKTIAIECDCTLQNVYRVVSGKHSNTDILLACAKLASEELAKKQEATRRIAKIKEQEKAQI